MASEQPLPPITLPGSTGGIAQYRGVKVHTNGRAAYPALGAQIVGVSQNATTGTDHAVGIAYGGVTKIEATGSTLAKGDTFSVNAVGRAVPSTAGAYAVGWIIDGSSGSTGRLLTALLLPIGTT